MQHLPPKNGSSVNGEKNKIDDDDEEVEEEATTTTTTTTSNGRT